MKAVLFAGGQIRDDAFAAEIVRSADLLICADAGILHAARLGFHADVCVGDFDSSVPPKEAATEWITLPTEKNDTDTMSAARLVVQRGADEATLLAAAGTRLDHTLGNLFVLEFLRCHGVSARLIDEHNEVFLAGQGSWRIPKKEGCYLSLLPFCSRPVVSVSGVKYPLRQARLPADQPLGVSNQIVESEASLTVATGVVAVFLSHD